MNALILVDLQNDFMPGGALGVPGGDEVIAVAHRLIPQFDHVVLTQDWHPKNHLSFAKNHPGRSINDVVQMDGIEQVLWPVHCVEHSHGAAFADQLTFPCESKIVRKGTRNNIDSYSGFFDNGRLHETELASHLKRLGVDEVMVMGLATDYCVKFTALDAVALGFKASLHVDGCRGVNLQPNDVADAIEEMEKAGVVIES